MATASPEPETVAKQQESGGEADAASACITDDSQDVQDATTLPSVAQTPEIATRETPLENVHTLTPTKNIVDLKVFVHNLDITGMGRTRSRLRFTKAGLSKWGILRAAEGIQFYKGFDNLPPYKGLASDCSGDEDAAVQVVTAGLPFLVTTLVNLALKLAHHICRHSMGL